MGVKAIDHVVESEVLVIGSGLAGALAAIGCHKSDRKVVIVNKGRLCWGGSSIVVQVRGTNLCLPGDDKQLWMRHFVESSHYLADQEWARTFLEESYACALELNHLGKEYGQTIYPPDPNGGTAELWHFRGYGQKFPMRVLMDVTAAMVALRKKIIADKIGFFERVEVTHLLTDGHKVVGAVAFNYRSGETYLFRARAVILAAGQCRFTSDVVDSCGEGLAMAYEAGCQMRSFDVGGVYIRPRFTMYSGALGDSIVIGLPYSFGAKIVNRAGGTFLDKNLAASGVSAQVGLEIARRKEIAQGKGPIFEDYTQISPEMKRLLRKGRKAAWKLAKAKYGVDVFETRVPINDNMEQIVTPAFGAVAGGVWVDHQGASTIPGLYVVGDTTWPVFASHTSGAGLGWVILTGSKVGGFVASYVASAPDSTITDKELVEQARKHIDNLALPLTRTTGLSPDELTSRVLRCMIPYDEVRSNKDNLQSALAEIARLQHEDLPNTRAKDYHELKKVFEAQSMVLTAEMILRSDLFRMESDCGMRRQDSPTVDDNSLKWINIDKREGKMYVSTQDVPTPYIKPPPSVGPPPVGR